MKLDTSLSDLERTVSLCLRCGMCTYGQWPECYPLCPIYSRHRIYTASAGGLVYLVRALAENKIGYTKTMVEFAYQCPLCEACDMCQIIPVPPPHTSPSEVIRFLRHQLVKQGMVPEEIKETYQQAQKMNSDIRTKFDLEVPAKVKDEHANTVLFVEGIHSQCEHKIYQSAIRLLEKMKRPLAIFGLDGASCGVELYDLGFWDELGRLLDKRTKIMKRLDGKEVIFINPHAQEFMLKRYPEIVSGGPQILGRHFSELLKDSFEEGRLSAKRQKIKASYHDPCHLARGLGIHEAPRDVLSFLGVELIEMKRNRENTYCCGAGGKSQSFPNFSDSVAAERIKEFEETGADVLITACPYCKEAFQRVLPLEEKNRVQDLIEFVDEQTE